MLANFIAIDGSAIAALAALNDCPGHGRTQLASEQ